MNAGKRAGRAILVVSGVALGLALVGKIRPAEDPGTRTIVEPEPDERLVSPGFSQSRKPATDPDSTPDPYSAIALLPEPKAGTVASHWIDPREKAVRQRIRIEETGGKYPLVRRLEEVFEDPESGEERFRLIHASVADHVLVGAKAGLDATIVGRELRERGFVVRAVEPGSFLLVEVPSPRRPEAQDETLHALAALDEFLDFSEPDYLVWPTVLPNDPAVQSGRMWPLDNQGDSHGRTLDADIDAREGWETRATAADVIVAIADTGINHTHEDLAENMWVNPGEIPDDGIDNDNNGVVDDVHGFDAEEDDGNPDDENGHGTHVAGTAGARGNNGLGLTGVAWEVQLMGLKFLSEAGGATSDAIRCINYARIQGADIINASWGGSAFSIGLYNAVAACAAEDIPFVAAAGNDATDNDATPHYPSSFDLPNVVAVTATTSEDALSAFSNRGRYGVDLAAPGSAIWSCFHRSDNDYKAQNGTSMAAPHVAGALALATAHFPDDGADELLARLYSSVDRLPALRNQLATGGRLNLQALLDSSDPGIRHDAWEEALAFDGNYGFWSGSNSRATREADEDRFSRPGTGRRSLWFRWEAPHSGLVQFEAVSENAPLRAIAFRGAQRSRMTPVSDDQTASASERLHFHAQAGATYRFLVDSDSASGESISVELLLRPGNDQLADASPLAGDRFAATATNRGATAEPFEQNQPHGGAGTGQSIWWTWTPETSGSYVVTTMGSSFDTVLAVYTSTADGLAPVASSDDRNSFDWTSEATFAAVAGTTYYLAVDSFRPRQWGDVVLNGFQVGELAFLRDLEPVRIRPGQRVELEVLVNGGEEVSYDWFHDGEPIPFATGPRLVFDRVRGEDAGKYFVVARRGVDAIQSREVALTIASRPPEIVWHSPDQAVSAGTDLELQVSAFGSGTLYYQWYRETEPIPDGTNAVLKISDISRSDAGFYSVSVTNGAGTVETPAIEVTIQERPWGSWSWVRPRPFSAEIQTLEHVDGRFVALAPGALSVSVDGVDWQPRPLPGPEYTPKSLAFGNGLYVLGTDTSDPPLLISNDLAGFREVSIAGDGASEIPEIEFGAGVFVARGILDVFTSGNGIDWQRANLDLTPDIEPEDLAFGAGLFVVKAEDTTSFTSPDGRSWTKHTDAPPGEGILEFLDGEFRFWSDASPHRYFTSTNGIDWSGVPSNHPPSKNGSGRGRVIHMDGQYALADRELWVSSNGSSWSSRQLGSGIHVIHALARDNDRVVVTGRPGTLGYASNLDELILEPNPYDLLGHSVEFINGEFVLGGGVGFSDLGDHWDIRQPTLADSQPHQLAYAFGSYWSVRESNGFDGGILTGSSPENMEKLLLDGQRFIAIVAGGDKMIAVDSDRHIWVTGDGTNWTETNAVADCQTPMPYYLEERFLILCGKEILLSSGGQNWTSLDPADLSSRPLTAHYQGACEAFGKLCVVSNAGDICVSPDGGSSWETTTTTLDYPEWSFGGRNVRAAGNEDSLVLVYGPGRIKYTTDLSEWVEEPAPARSFSDITYGNGTYVLHSGYHSAICHGTIDRLPFRVELGSPLDGAVFQRTSLPVGIDLRLIDPGNVFSHLNLYTGGELVAEGLHELQLDLSRFEAGAYDLEIEVVSTDGQSTRVRAGRFEIQEAGDFVNALRSQPRITLVERINGTLVAADSGGTIWSLESDRTWRRRSLPVAAPVESILATPEAIYVSTPTSTYRSEDFASFELLGDRLESLSAGELGLAGIRDGELYLSDTGRSWETAAVDADSVSTGNGVIEAGGFWSDDGDRFRETLQSPPGDPAFLNGMFWAGGSGQLASSEDADTWTTRHQFAPVSVRNATLTRIGRILFSGGRYFATAHATFSPHNPWLTFTSADGSTWSRLSDPMRWKSDRGGLAFARDAWWFASDRGIHRSDDGVTWSLVVEESDLGKWDQSFFYGSDSGLLVIAPTGEFGEVDLPTGRILETGSIGETSASSVEDDVRIVRSGPLGTLIFDDQLYFTRDFEVVRQTWSDDMGLYDFAVGENRMALISYPDRYWESRDGVSWKEGPSLELEDGNRVSRIYMFDDTVFVTTVLRNTDNVFVRTGDSPWSSIDIADFTTRTADLIEDLTRVDGEYWALTERNSLLRSTDGLDWSLVAEARVFLPVAKIGDRYVGRRLSESQYGLSPNGASWQFVNGPQGFSVDIEGMEMRGGTLYLSTEDGDLWTTTDLEDWVRQPITDEDLFLTPSGPGGVVPYSRSGIWVQCRDRDFFTGLTVAEPREYYGANDVLQLDLERTNRGSVPLAGTEEVPVEIVMSDDGFLGGLDDLVLGTVTLDLDALDAGQSETHRLELTLPGEVPVGSFHLFALAEKPCVLGSGFRPLQTRTGRDVISIPEWNLVLEVDGGGAITSDSARRSFAHNSLVSLSARAGKGTKFAGWEGDAVGGLSQVTVLMNGDRTVKANFVPVAALQVRVSGSGEVAGGADSGGYELGTSVSLRAIPAPGWVFAGWSGAIETEEPELDFDMNAPKTLHAAFTLPIANWRELHFSAEELGNPLVSADDADPDRDGLPNRREYLHGSDPHDPRQNGIISLSSRDGFFSLLYTRLQAPEGDEVLRVLSSRDGLQWDAGVDERILSVADGVETREARLPVAGHPHGFVGFSYAGEEP